ncbi:jhy protein homolog [Leptosomus discolor]
MSKTHVPQNVLKQPDFHPANCKRPSVSKGGFASSLHDSQESDSESLFQEKQYQLGLQQRIRENEELVGLCSDALENDSLEEDSLEDMSLREQGAEYDTNQYINEIQNCGNGRKEQPVDKYFSLRYNPNWKNTKEVAEFSEAEKASQVAGGSSVDFSQGSFYLRSSGSPEKKNQQKVKSQDSFSEFGTELLSFCEPTAVVSNEPFRLHTKGKESADNCHFKDSPSTNGHAFCLQMREDQSQRVKKDFVERNKQTLGLRSEKINSYLQLHSKKQEKVLQEQVKDPNAIDEEPVQRVLPFQTVKMEPEDKWYLKVQQLKDHQNKSSQRNKIKSDQSLKGRAFRRHDSQPPPGRPAEPKSWHHRHHQTAEFQAAPVQAVEQDNSSALKKWPHPRRVGPDTSTAANSDTCLNNFPNSRHFVNHDFTTSTYPFHPTLHKFNPAEVVSPAYTSKENKKYQHDPPNGLPRDQQHLYNHVPVLCFTSRNSTNGQAHPNQRNISSTFSANFQELVKNQISLQDCKRPIYADKRYQQHAISSLCSPTAPCTTSQFTQMMERRHQEITRLTEAHLADRHLFSLLPPIIPQAESGSEVDPETSEGNQVKISRRISEGYLMQMEKQKQPKASNKPCSSKAYINLNVNVKLGGLGPDYEAIKEKKEKLKQQKEYAKQIKEHNMKSIASVQRLPTKPQVTSSLSRQKALEYAKKIPKPKTFMARQSPEEVKEERVLLQTLNGDGLPQITFLETLQNRHEKEKQVVAAFRTLHIL